MGCRDSVNRKSRYFLFATTSGSDTGTTQPPIRCGSWGRGFGPDYKVADAGGMFIQTQESLHCHLHQLTVTTKPHVTKNTCNNARILQLIGTPVYQNSHPNFT
jgi:hypothetical protein